MTFLRVISVLMLLAVQVQAADQKYLVWVNYDRPVEYAIGAGRYDMVNWDVNSEHFQGKRFGRGNVTIELVSCNGDISVNEFFYSLERKGLRPAELHEFLALGEMYPDLQRKITIMTSGSGWHDALGRSYLFLGGDNQERTLGIGYWSNWNHHERYFAAVLVK